MWFEAVCSNSNPARAACRPRRARVEGHEGHATPALAPTHRRQQMRRRATLPVPKMLHHLPAIPRQLMHAGYPTVWRTRIQMYHCIWPPYHFKDWKLNSEKRCFAFVGYEPTSTCFKSSVFSMKLDETDFTPVYRECIDDTIKDEGLDVGGIVQDDKNNPPGSPLQEKAKRSKIHRLQASGEGQCSQAILGYPKTSFSGGPLQWMELFDS